MKLFLLEFWVMCLRLKDNVLFGVLQGLKWQFFIVISAVSNYIILKSYQNVKPEGFVQKWRQICKKNRVWRFSTLPNNRQNIKIFNSSVTSFTNDSWLISQNRSCSLHSNLVKKFSIQFFSPLLESCML
jgi:hypothetical protein